MRTFISVTILIGLSFSQESDIKAPHWDNLECETGHKYLFSSSGLSWEDARSECELYGGWLLNIRDIGEQNCLLRYAQSQSFHDWFWTGAHIEDTAGVFVHSSLEDTVDVTWLGPRWNCGSVLYGGGDAVLLSTSSDGHHAGAWCDWPKANLYRFICESWI